MAETQAPFPAEAFLNFTLEGVRCFRDATSFDETRKVNIIAGENNTGKSTLLLPLRRLTTANHRPAVHYDGTAYASSGGVSAIRFEPGDISHGASQLSVSFLDDRLGHPRTLVRPVNGATQLEPPESHSVMLVTALYTCVRNIVFVPPRRGVRPHLHAGDVPALTESMFDGSTALSVVLDWTNPSSEDADGSEKGREKLRGLESMLRTILGMDVRVRALPKARDLEIELAGQAVALSRLGAGIEQALVFALVLVEYPTALLLIEEPENFLHPTVQRRLLHQLLEREGHAVVTTHSNHLLDVRNNDVAYFRTFRAERGSSSVERFQSNRRYAALWDLGVRPSSLFESNALLWVEGPSDAIYIRCWLQLHCEGKELVEGVDFSFAYHAGSLLKSFHADWGGDEDRRTTDVVDFCAVHPNFFIVADRDEQGDEIGHEYLRRLVADDKTKNVVWVTYGREIENYIPIHLLQRYLEERASPRRAVLRVPKQEAVSALRVWEVLNSMVGDAHRSDYPDKVVFATWVASAMEDRDLDTLDLQDAIDRLIVFIQQANDPNSTRRE